MGKAKGNRRSTGRGGGGRTGIGRDVGAVLLLAVAAGLLLALVSFSSLDAQLLARGLPPARNLVGRLGHWSAGVLYRALGLPALLLPAALLAYGVKLLRREPVRSTAIANGAAVVLVLCLSTLAELFLAGRGLATFPPGGSAGRFLCTRAVALLSQVGTGIFVSAWALVAAIVAVDLRVRDALAAALGSLRWVFAQLVAHAGEAIARHRAAVNERRAAEAEARARAVEEEEDEDGGAGEPAQRGGELAAPGFALAGGDDPAWARAPLAFAGAVADGAEPVERPRRRRRKGDDAPEPPIEAAPVVPEEASEGGPEPLVPLAVPEKPQIVLSAAMLDRGRREKDRKRKDDPEFAFTQSGAVFRLPTTELLDAREAVKQDLDETTLTRTADVIVATLRQHGVDGVIRHIRPGPVVTLYEFSPVAGVKLAKIENLDKELTMALSATRIRIIAPIPGKGVVGIEVPNVDRATVGLREVLESEPFHQAGGLLPLALGKNIEGVPYCVDLQRMPHLLIAGTTGSGKSVGLNTMILSMLYRQTPEQVRFIMVDPKMTELSIYEDVPHLLLPVVTDPQKAARALQWAVDEMERRTQILADTGSKDLKSYNTKVEKLRAEGRAFGDPDLPPPKKLVVVDAAEEGARAAEPGEPVAEPPTNAEYEDPSAPPPADPVAAREAEQEGKKLPQKLPYIVCIIDELADLMMTAPREVEISLARLAQKARATGIHLMVATQRPSTDVITGMIKNNFPARISFRLASRHDSTTIINGPGAESLLGDGDMLVLTATQPVTRVQGCFVSEGEIERVVAFLKEQGKPVYDESILKARDASGGGDRHDDEDDPVYDQALDLVSQMEEVSVSKLQREMRLGYNKAAKIVERMEREGIVGPANGVKPRQVLIGGRPGDARAMPNV
jgi:S-DNA-T family DNA segregation ATPase FtsK/SpoIIIE